MLIMRRMTRKRWIIAAAALAVLAVLIAVSVAVGVRATAQENDERTIPYAFSQTAPDGRAFYDYPRSFRSYPRVSALDYLVMNEVITEEQSAALAALDSRLINQYIGALTLIDDAQVDAVVDWLLNAPDAISALDDISRDDLDDDDATLDADLVAAIAAELGVDASAVSDAYATARAALADDGSHRNAAIVAFFNALAEELNATGAEVMDAFAAARAALAEEYAGLTAAERLTRQFNELNERGAISDSALASLNEWASDAPAALDELQSGKRFPGRYGFAADGFGNFQFGRDGFDGFDDDSDTDAPASTSAESLNA